MENGEMNNCRGKRAAVYHQIANRATGDVQHLLQQLISAASERDTKDGFLSAGRELLSAIKKSIGSRPVFKFASPAMRPRTTITKSGSVKCDEILRFHEDPTLSYLHLVGDRSAVESSDAIPQIHIRSKSVADWKWNKPMTEIFLECVSVGISTGISFAGKDVLVTGAGRGSIGAEVVRGLLMGGARVIVTTSRTVSETASFYRGLYEQNGSRGAELLVVPFNQGSVQDCESLIDYIYRASGLGRSLDAILPFAAVSEAGKEIDAIGAKSELAHRLMLVNFLRLLGCIVKCKREQNIFGRPTQVVLPLSPNHGTFGGDGLYSESKLGLASLLNRFHSENWSDFISIAGAMIGWTRGTGLMSENVCHPFRFL
jgi:fatty acid synthase subunit alpha